MKGDRFRHPVKAAYAETLARATFWFAICEWNVFGPASELVQALGGIVDGELTASKISKQFIDSVRNMPRTSQRQELANVAQEFEKLVKLPNSIIYGKPCTGSSGEARLSDQSVFEIFDLEKAPDTFSACSIEVNRLLHGYLATYAPELRTEKLRVLLGKRSRRVS
jgi:hypothetical protein